MSRDTANINDQLGQDPDVFPLLNANYNEKILIEEGPLRISGNTLGNAWIAGTSTNGIVGTNTGTEGGGQQVVGGSGRVETVKQVINKNNLFRERLRFNIFEDTGTTDATVDYTTDHDITFATGEIYQSLAIAKRASSELVIPKAKITLEGTNTSLASIYLSADAGANWESVTNDTWHTFTNTGRDLRYKIVATAAPGFPFTFPITFPGNLVITLVKIQY